MENMTGIYRLGREPELDGEKTVVFGYFERDVDAYAWIITHDYIEDGEYNAVGTTGPGTADEEMLKAVEVEGRHRTPFKMYDDDGELYYGGFFTMDDEHAHGEAMAGPLDDFGRPNAGAITVVYPDRPDWDCE